MPTDALFWLVEELMEEIHLYLATIDLFRALGHEPTWR